MAVRIPTINPSATFSKATGDTAPQLFSTNVVKPVGGRGVIDGASAIPSDTQTLTVERNVSGGSLVTYLTAYKRGAN